MEVDAAMDDSKTEPSTTTKKDSCNLWRGWFCGHRLVVVHRTDYTATEYDTEFYTSDRC